MLIFIKYSLLSVTDESTGMSPLHIAAKNGKAEYIKAVVALSLNIPYYAVDDKGNTLYHYASQNNKETIEVGSTQGSLIV